MFQGTKWILNTNEDSKCTCVGLFLHTNIDRQSTLGYGENTSYSSATTAVVPIEVSVRHPSCTADAIEFQSESNDFEGNLCIGDGHRSSAAN